MESVIFTADDPEFARQWVQDRAEQGEIVATTKRLYLPVLTTGMVAVEPGDLIQFDPDLPGPNAFSVVRDADPVLG